MAMDAISRGLRVLSTGIGACSFLGLVYILALRPPEHSPPARPEVQESPTAPDPSWKTIWPGSPNEESHLQLAVVGIGYDQATSSSFWDHTADLVVGLQVTDPFAYRANNLKIDAVCMAQGPSSAYTTQDVLSAFASGSSDELTSTLLQVIGSASPYPDVAIVINNKGGETEGGTTWLYNESGALKYPLVVYSSGDARVILHELGHAIGLLADEYDSKIEEEAGHHPLLTSGPNVSSASSPLDATWAHFLKLDGADEYSWWIPLDSGMHKAWSRCKMASLADPFCPVCMEVLDARIAELCSTEWSSETFHARFPLANWSEAR